PTPLLHQTTATPRTPAAKTAIPTSTGRMGGGSEDAEPCIAMHFPVEPGHVYPRNGEHCRMESRWHGIDKRRYGYTLKRNEQPLRRRDGTRGLCLRSSDPPGMGLLHALRARHRRRALLVGRHPLP